LLKIEYPNSACALKYETIFQLLVATVLSAQCTDERVNMVTPILFSKYPTPKALNNASLAEIEKIIRSTGFYKNKALSLISISKTLVEDHASSVPKDLDELVRLRGVGRKTANVVLGVGYGIASGIVVDTHVKRISNRIGLTSNSDPVKIEADLVTLVQKKDWVIFSQLMIDHGRAICSARRAPSCDQCVINTYCQKNGVR